MAGDWIKFELVTSDKPEVFMIASELDIDADAVIGKLLRMWGWFDQHSIDGNAPSVTVSLLDRIVCVTGFCDAVQKVGWLDNDGTILSIPNFVRHNGKTGKNRALTRNRQENHRQKNNDPSVTFALPEKRREEKSSKSSDSTESDDHAFNEFWANYPRKDDKKKARVAFNRLCKTKKLMAINDCKTRYLGVEKRFIPLPTTYIRGERWEGELMEPGELNQPEKRWHEHWTGIVAKGKEYNIFEEDYDSAVDFKAAVFKAVGHEDH